MVVPLLRKLFLKIYCKKFAFTKILILSLRIKNRNAMHFNIEIILEKYKLDPSKVAAVLFPKSKEPHRNLYRVRKGLQSLDTNQLISLAFMAGVPVGSLFESEDGWRLIADEGVVIAFTKKGVRAFLDTATNTVEVLKGSRRYVIQVRPDLSLLELYSTIDNLIKTAENDQN